MLSNLWAFASVFLINRSTWILLLLFFPMPFLKLAFNHSIIMFVFVLPCRSWETRDLEQPKRFYFLSSNKKRINCSPQMRLSFETLQLAFVFYLLFKRINYILKFNFSLLTFVAGFKIINLIKILIQFIFKQKTNWFVLFF